MLSNSSKIHRRRALVPLVLAFALSAVGDAVASTCYGTVARGRLEGGVQLPLEGANFLPYSRLGVQMGRTYVHAAVRDAVVDAYRALGTTARGRVFVYGETGKESGGEIKPHRTHQSGLSVDFMVPVADASGASVPLPGNVFNKFGYGLEFDAAGTAGDLKIDFEALAEHLYQLQVAAKRRGMPIARVIFDPQLSRLLFKTKRGAELEKTLPFMKRPAWIRHDEHYHVDFALPCRSLGEFARQG